MKSKRTNEGFDSPRDYKERKAEAYLNLIMVTSGNYKFQSEDKKWAIKSR